MELQRFPRHQLFPNSFCFNPKPGLVRVRNIHYFPLKLQSFRGFRGPRGFQFPPLPVHVAFRSSLCRVTTRKPSGHFLFPVRCLKHSCRCLLCVFFAEWSLLFLDLAYNGFLSYATHMLCMFCLRVSANLFRSYVYLEVTRTFSQVPYKILPLFTLVFLSFRRDQLPEAY